MGVGEPAQQLGRLLRPPGSGRSRRRLGLDLVGDLQRPLPHLRPVLDGLPHVAEHPVEVLGELAAGSAASGTRSISIRIQDSTMAPSPPLGGGARVGYTSSSWPATSRRTTSSGWITRWMARPRRLSSAVTESTRNGMSSLTTSTTECCARTSSSSASAVVTRTRTRALRPADRQLAVREERPPSAPRPIAASEVLGRDVPVVALQELPQGRRAVGSRRVAARSSSSPWPARGRPGLSVMFADIVVVARPARLARCCSCTRSLPPTSSGAPPSP